LGEIAPGKDRRGYAATEKEKSKIHHEGPARQSHNQRRRIHFNTKVAPTSFLLKDRYLKTMPKARNEPGTVIERVPQTAGYPSRPGEGRRSVLVAVTIFVITSAVFVPVLQNGFLNWGDEPALLANERYRSFGWAQLKWMFTSFYMGHYQPLTWGTFAVDHFLWGLEPFGFHLTNVVLHGLNAVVFFFVCRRLFSLVRPDAPVGKVAPTIAACFATLVFSIHPLRVGSVAWASQRGDLLSAFFILCTILLYIESVAGRDPAHTSRKWLNAALLVYALSLLSRASGVVLPIVLLVLDIYPLRRLTAGRGKWFLAQGRAVLGEKIPFVVLAAAFGLIALIARREPTALTPLEPQDIWTGIAQGLFASFLLLWKTFFPASVAPLHELSGGLRAGDLTIALGVFVAVCAALGLLFVKRGWLAAPVVWISYLAFLIPFFVTAVTGLSLDAERSSYLSCLGWAMLIGSALFYGWPGGIARPGRNSRLAAGAGVACIVLIYLGALTWRQTKFWQDSETLWRHALAIHPESATVHYYLGLALHQQGAFEAAEGLYRQSLEKQPSAEAHSSLGEILIRGGKSDEAVHQFREALKIDPAFARALSGLGVLLARQGMREQALPYLRKAAASSPGDSQIRYDLAVVLATTSELEEAVEHFSATVRLKPDHPQAHYNLGVVLASQGQLQDAMRHFRETLTIDANYTKAHHQLAVLLNEQGNTDEAVGHLRRALQLEPEFAEAHESLGRLLVRLGKRDEAIHHFEEAVRIVRSRPAVQPLP
jgi:protein O-mannosyl-transferase